MNLSDFLHNQPVPQPEAHPPPVPYKDHKDRSVDASVISRPAGPRESSMPARAPAPVHPRMVPIPLTPPPMRYRPSSPSSLSDSMSFLSSHHSDDFSLMDATEDYPPAPYPRSASPSWSSSSFESSDVSSEESVEVEAPAPRMRPPRGPRMPEPELPPLPVEIPVPVEGPASPEGTVVSSPMQRERDADTIFSSTPVSESLPSSGTYISRSSSPSISETESSITARPSPDTHLRELLDSLKDQTSVLRDGQAATNDMLEEIRRRGTAPEVIQALDKLGRLEDLLGSLLDRLPGTQPAPQPRERESFIDSGSETSSSIDRLRDIWDEINQARREPPTIYMPTPIRAGPSLDDQMADFLGSVPPPQTVPVQAPPTLIPLVYRPAPRATRPRSASPTSFVDLPRRSSSVPIPDISDMGVGRGTRRARGARASGGRRSRAGPDAPTVTGIPTSQAPSAIGGPSRRPRDEGPDINFLDELRDLRARRTGDRFFTTRPPTAPRVRSPLLALTSHANLFFAARRSSSLNGTPESGRK